MALHQRQRQSCSRRTLPQFLSHTTHLALTGRLPSSHWWGINTWDKYGKIQRTWDINWAPARSTHFKQVGQELKLSLVSTLLLLTRFLSQNELDIGLHVLKHKAQLHHSPLPHPQWCHFLWRPAWSICSCWWSERHSACEPWTYKLQRRDRWMSR